MRILVPYLDEWYTEFEERIDILSKNVKIYIIKPRTKIEPHRTDMIDIKLISINRKIFLMPLFLIIVFIKGIIIGRKEKIDIIQVFDPHFGGLSGALLSKILCKPFLLVVRANYYNGHLLHLRHRYGRLTSQAKLRLLILKKIIFLSYNSANHIIVKSNFQKQEMKNWNVFESKVSVIPTGINLEMFNRNNLSKIDIKKFKLETLKLKEERKIILSFIGRLQPEKGILFLLDVINGLNPTVKKSMYVFLIGKSIPGYFEEIQKRIAQYKLKETVKIISYLDHKKIPLALASSDLLVYPTQGNTEGIPVILQEALGMGVPCLVSDFGGVEEIIENERDGFILPQNDINAWVEKIELLIEKEEIRHSLAKDCRKKIQNVFNRENNYKKFFRILNKFLKEAG